MNQITLMNKTTLILKLVHLPLIRLVFSLTAQITTCLHYNIVGDVTVST